MKNNQNIKIDNFAFNIFIFLFFIIYIGMVLKIFLPVKIQETSIDNYLAQIFLPDKEVKGEVAGVSTNTMEEGSGLLDSALNIPRNFVNNVVESLRF